MALYAFDGTWNKDEEGQQHDTNVVLFRDSYLQEKFYEKGPGTRWWLLGKFLGGVFGAGGFARASEAKDRLKKNFAKGDRAIDIVGFSRGAAIALHFANRIAEEGVKVKDPETGKKTKVFPRIRFLGLWDTVASFGLVWPPPLQKVNWGWKLQVPDAVEHCYHALAIDELRETFRPTRNERAYEVWFRGYHSDIGGGKDNLKSRSNIALRWMMKKALAAGVPVKPGVADTLAVDVNARLSPPKDLVKDPPRRIRPQDRIHYTVDQSTVALEKGIEIPVGAPRETQPLEGAL